jgi:hypothetical protein
LATLYELSTCLNQSPRLFQDTRQVREFAVPCSVGAVVISNHPSILIGALGKSTQDVGGSLLTVGCGSEDDVEVGRFDVSLGPKAEAIAV